MYKSKVTPAIASYIFSTYQAMKEPIFEKEKMMIISDGIEERFGEKFSPGSLRILGKKAILM